MFGNTINTTPFTMPVAPVGNGYGGGFGNGIDDIIALAIIAMILGWNGNGGFFGGNARNGSVADAYVLNSDFATIQRQLSDGFGSTESKLDSVNNGLCSLGYDQLAQMNGINQNISNTGWNVERAIQADTIANMQNQFGIMNAIADSRTNCNNNYRSIAEQLTSCCCDLDKQFAQTRYDMATQNCSTLQAIDKVGDRIIDYMANKEAQALRDENFTLKLSASQSMQNNYLISQLGQKQPVPAYWVANPNCNCNGGFPYPYGYFNGTTIA